MSSQSIGPAWICPGQPARPLVHLPKVHSEFDERFLQDLLANHPELLPIAGVRHDVGHLLCIGREVGVPSGSIDNLYLSTAGYPVLVETKLWRNPQARREVLSQTLDYIKDLAQRDFDWFEKQWESHRAGTPYPCMSLIDRLSELAQDEVDEREFIDRVNHALLRGDILAMIVGDGIESRLQELVAHLCKDSAHLRYALALCELSFYQLGAKGADGMIVVPRIVSNVVPVQRAYVRVDVADALAGKVVVTPVSVETEVETRPVRTNLNEEQFLRSIEASVGAERRKQIQDAYNDLIESFGLEPDFRAAALMLKVADPREQRPGASVLGFHKNGTIYNTEHLLGQLERWVNFPSETAKRITSDYWMALNQIDCRFAVNGLTHSADRRFIPFADVFDKWHLMREEIGIVTKRIREAREDEEA